MLRMFCKSLPAEEDADRGSAQLPVVSAADQLLLQQTWTAENRKKRYPTSVCTSLKDLCEM